MQTQSPASFTGRKRKQRFYFLAIALVLLASSTALITIALEDNITFFYTPSELKEKNILQADNIRIGGMVVENSLQHKDDGTIYFLVTDLENTLAVSFKGIPPDLFAEGQGVIAEGALSQQGALQAKRILAKHDETYMPPNIAQ